MACELKTQFLSGATVYAVVLNAAGQAWRTDANVFEAPATGNWAYYAIAMAEQSMTGVYEGNFPAAITAAGAYPVLFRQQSGSFPAATDQNNGMLGGTVYWTGIAEAFPLASSASYAANVAMSGTNLNANVAQWAGTAVSLSGGLPSVNAANVAGGDGPIPINQNTGGTDNLRYVDTTGAGIEGAGVLIYLATDWPSQPGRVQATATTGPDGRWLSPAFVQSGTYVAVFSKLGADGPDVSPPFSV